MVLRIENSSLRTLQQLASGDSADYERRRRLRLADKLSTMHKSWIEHPGVLIEAPTNIVNQELVNLPHGIVIEAGQITVRFTTSGEALEKLLALAMAIGNDLDAFERLAGPGGVE